jgi:divinyl chlorophyllide a 8-vinyl-reductase
MAGQHIFLLGATGTIGRAVLAEALARGHDVTTFGRKQPQLGPQSDSTQLHRITGDVTASAQLKSAISSARADVLISCLASRTGNPAEADAIDHLANVAAIAAAKAAGVRHIILLSAICVQKPELAFQFAKLKAEAALIASGLTYSIVRPTAFFKSLSGQVQRVAAGKPFLLFGNGQHTACKPISDADLARYLVDCLDNPACQNHILPIGGPGAAITPQDQAEMLFALTGQSPRYRRMPLGLMRAIAGGLSAASKIFPPLKTKAEMAKIGLYYASESMLVWDAQKNAYDADATPETGRDTLRDHYAKLLRGEIGDDRGDHAIF